MDQNELSLDPCHLGVASGVPKMIFQARGTFSPNRAPILSRDLNYLQMDQNKLRHDSRHQGVPSGVPKMNSILGERSVQTVHHSCFEIKTISK